MKQRDGVPVEAVGAEPKRLLPVVGVEELPNNVPVVEPPPNSEPVGEISRKDDVERSSLSSKGKEVIES